MQRQGDAGGGWVGAVAVLIVLLLASGMFYYEFYYLGTGSQKTQRPANVTATGVTGQSERVSVPGSSSLGLGLGFSSGFPGGWSLLAEDGNNCK